MTYEAVLSTPNVRVSTTRDKFDDAVQRQDFMAELVTKRIALGIKARDVAAAMGVTPSTVSELENHQDDPRLSTIQRYARAIGVSVSFTTVSPAAQGWTGLEPTLADRFLWRQGSLEAVGASVGAIRFNFATDFALTA